MITYKNGDATDIKHYEGDKYIIHICNDIGGWGKGFVLAISSRWKEPEKQYRAKKEYKLGTFQSIKVDGNIHVVNMIAQHGTKWENGIPPIRYDALKTCLEFLNIHIKTMEDEKLIKNPSIHCPRIGCGLSGASWDKIEPILNILTLPVYVYDFKDNNSISHVTQDDIDKRKVS